MSEIIYNQKPLKPCPFCGENGFIYRRPLWNGSHGYHDNYSYYVACKNPICFVQPKTAELHNIYEPDTERIINKIVGFWNEREEKENERNLTIV